jgi:hypothetical protein
MAAMVTMNDEEQSVIATRLRDVQPGISERTIERVLSRLGEEELAMAIAVSWGRTGEMPDEPRIKGLSPASLIEHFKPSVVLGALADLVREPQAVLATFQHPDSRWFKAGPQ